MATGKVSEAEFIELFTKYGGAETARIIGVSERNVHHRRVNLEKKHGPIKTRDTPSATRNHLQKYPHRLEFNLKNGHILIGSDSHYWPDLISTAHRAFVAFNKEYKPAIVIKNGDAMDGASISRHAPIGWENKPTVIQEIETVKERLHEIEQVNKNATYIWPLGNHDARYETRLATVASEYAKVHGFHLKDHMPRWVPCWSAWVNDIVIKHRYKGGVHATHNNTVGAGKHIVTGHLHSLKVTPYSDYNGTRYGVDTGTLADPYGPQFADYGEDNPKNHRSGFVLLTIRNHRLMWPEVIHVLDEEKGEVEFRGEIINV